MFEIFLKAVSSGGIVTLAAAFIWLEYQKTRKSRSAPSAESLPPSTADLALIREALQEIKEKCTSQSFEDRRIHEQILEALTRLDTTTEDLAKCIPMIERDIRDINDQLRRALDT